MTPAGAGPATRRPSPIGWVYVALGCVILCVGLSAGVVFFSGRPSFLTFLHDATVCARQIPVAPDRETAAELYACMRSAAVPLLGTQLAALAVTVCWFALLLVLIPAYDQWRLRTGHTETPSPEVEERFARLCAESGLHGRRRPRLVLAGPPVRQAFTTGVPGRRPLVVLPLVLALRGDPEAFDVTVRHELGHVHAGDAGWVTLMRGLVRGVAPVLAAAFLPFWFVTGGATGAWEVSALLRSGTLVLAVAVLAAYLLRLREREADRYAARAGTTAGVIAVLGAAPASARRGPPARLFARHPDRADRIAALSEPARARPTGFGRGLLAGALAVASANAVYSVAMAFPDVSLVHDLVPSAALVLTLLGVLLLPLLRYDRPGLRRPALYGGAVTGLALGGYLWPGLPGLLAGVWLQQPGWGGAVRTALLMALMGCGLLGMTAVLAGVTRSRLAAPAVVVAGTGFVYAVHTFETGSAIGSALFLVESPWSLGMLALPIALLLTGAVRGSAWRAGLVVVVLGAAALAVHVPLNPVTGAGPLRESVTERVWLCFVVGVAFLLATRWRLGRPGLSTAVAGGTLVTAALGTLHLLPFLMTNDSFRTPGAVRLFVELPVLWFLLASMLLLPLLGRRGRPRTSRPGPAWAAATASVAASALVLAGVDPVSVEIPSDPPATTAPRPPVLLPVPRADPGRHLSQEDGVRIARAGSELLPEFWVVAPDEPPTPPQRSPVRPASCDAHANQDFVPRNRREGRTFHAQFVTRPDGDGSIRVIVSTSADPVPGNLREIAETDRGRCGHFTDLSSGLEIDVTSYDVPRTGEQSWGTQWQMREGIWTGTETFLHAVVGRNLVTVLHLAQNEPASDELVKDVLARTVAALAE